jgi:hypothetical protein
LLIDFSPVDCAPELARAPALESARVVEPSVARLAATPADFSSSRRLKGEPKVPVDLDDVLTCALVKLDSDSCDCALSRGKLD